MGISCGHGSVAHARRGIAAAALLAVTVACNADAPATQPRGTDDGGVCAATHVRAAISARIVSGNTMPLIARAFRVVGQNSPAAVAAGITWTSSDSSVVSIDGGYARALRTGSATVTATACGSNDAVAVAVVSAGYAVVPIAIPGAQTVTGLALNDSGTVAGTANTGAGWVNFLWRDGTVTGLGDCLPQSLNNRDEVLCAQSGLRVWSNGAISLRDTITGQMLRINDAGHVLVERLTSAPLLWRGQGQATALSLPYVADLSNGGDVLGTDVVALQSYPTLWRNGDLVRIGTLGGATELVAASDAGDVVGTALGFRGRPSIAMLARAAAGWGAELLSGTETVPNDVTGSTQDINIIRQVVGSGIGGPFVWRAGQVVLLNAMRGDTTWTIQSVQAINAGGRILAIANRAPAGPRVAVVLDPSNVVVPGDTLREAR